MKPERGMYQAAMRVNGLSPVITNVAEVDTVHYAGRQYLRHHQGQGVEDSAGVLDSGMVQDGWDVNLGDPLSSSLRMRRYVGTSGKRQGLTEGLVEVGLTDSTRSVGKPRAWGRGRQDQRKRGVRI